jgi:hypothetical protein
MGNKKNSKSKKPSTLSSMNKTISCSYCESLGGVWTLQCVHIIYYFNQQVLSFKMTRSITIYESQILSGGGKTESNEMNGQF